MWQPEPEQSRPGGSGDDRRLPPAGPFPARPPARRRGGLKAAVFSVLLAAGLAGLAVAAVGIAHQLLPRRFSAAQRTAISAWELQSRWRALAAGTIFPGSVSYQLPAGALNGTSGLELRADRLGISPMAACSAAVSGTASRILREYHCSAAMRATYVDSSGGMVATVVVAVLPSAAAARTVVAALTGTGTSHPAMVRALAIPGTPSAAFADADRQLSDAADAGPYVIMSAAGFSDGRRRVHISADHYLDSELTSLTGGLIHSAGQALGRPPPVPACPGAPGC